MFEQTLIEVGDAVGVVLPQEILERLGVQVGDALFVTANDDGLMLTIEEPDEAQRSILARQIAERRSGIRQAMAEQGREFLARHRRPGPSVA